jgi:RNA polymerase sigma-70 factor (ECF subfamily)
LSRADAARVRSVLFLNGVPAVEIEDATQEVELRALQRPPRGVAPGAWACAVATNWAIDRHRRLSRRARAVPSPDVGEPARESERVELRDAVRRGLEGLDAELRATVVLRFYADLAVSDIASAMGVPQGTVKSRLHRAVEELRAALPAESLR